MDEPIYLPVSFSAALMALKSKRKVARKGWNGKGMWLILVNEWDCLERPSEIPTIPFIAMKTADDKLVPWLASQTDILAEDWEIVQ